MFISKLSDEQKEYRFQVSLKLLNLVEYGPNLFNRVLSVSWTENFVMKATWLYWIYRGKYGEGSQHPQERKFPEMPLKVEIYRCQCVQLIEDHFEGFPQSYHLEIASAVLKLSNRNSYT